MMVKLPSGSSVVASRSISERWQLPGAFENRHGFERLMKCGLIP